MLGKERNGREKRAGIPSASHSAGAVLEAEPLSVSCPQVTTAFSDTVLEPTASAHRPTVPPGVQPGKGSGFMSLPLGLTGQEQP